MIPGRLTILSLALVALVSPVRAAPAARTGADRPYRDHRLVTAQPRSDADVEAIWRLAENVLEPHDPARAPHRIVVTPATVRRLRALRIPLRVEPDDVAGWIAAQERAARRPPGTAADVGLGIFGDFFGEVQELAAIEAELDRLAAASSGRARVVVLGKSFEGRDIKAMRISSAPEPSGRASIVVVGTQHAREWASPMVTMGLIDALVRRYGVDPLVTRVVDNLEVYINPVNNPDGYLATFNGRRLQRKNLNSTCNVDLNRNYATAWGAGTAGAGCNSGIYPGQGAFSEPESQAIGNLIATLAHPALFYDYHSTAAQVMIPHAYTTAMPPGYAKNRALCELYSSALRAVHGTSYPARPGFNLGRGQGGGAFDWFRATRADAIVVELGGGAGFSIADDQIIPFAEENLAAWLAVAQKVVDEHPADRAPPATDAGAPAPDAAAPVIDAAPPAPDAAAPDMMAAALPGAVPPSGPAPTGPPPAGPAPTAPPAPGLPPPLPPAGRPGHGLAAPDDPTAEEIVAGCQCALEGAPRRLPTPLATAAALLLALALRRRRRS